MIWNFPMQTNGLLRRELGEELDALKRAQPLCHERRERLQICQKVSLDYRPISEVLGMSLVCFRIRGIRRVAKAETCLKEMFLASLGFGINFTWPHVLFTFQMRR